MVAWGWACGGRIKSQRPGTLNPSLRWLTFERERERERSAGWKHAESGTVAVLLLLSLCFCFCLFCFALLSLRLLQGRRARVSGTWVREACVRRQESRGGYPGCGRSKRRRGSRRGRKRSRRLGLGCVCGALAFCGAHMVVGRGLVPMSLLQNDWGKCHLSAEWGNWKGTRRLKA
jgi:hypothetical protein